MSKNNQTQEIRRLLARFGAVMDPEAIGPREVVDIVLPLADHLDEIYSELESAAAEEKIEIKGQPNGVAPLDANALVPEKHLPATAFGVIQFGGMVSGVTVQGSTSDKGYKLGGAVVVYNTDSNRFVLEVTDGDTKTYYRDWSNSELHGRIDPDNGSVIPRTDKIFIHPQGGGLAYIMTAEKLEYFPLKRVTDAIQEQINFLFDKSSNYFNLDTNSGKDYPMVFAEDALSRDHGTSNLTGYHLNRILKNIQVFTPSPETANAYSYELAYINRTQGNAGLWDNAIGFVQRDRVTGELLNLRYEHNVVALRDGNSDYTFVWEIGGDIIAFTLDCSKAPTGFALAFSNSDTAVYAKKMWLNKKQYFYTGVKHESYNPTSVLNVSVEGEELYVAAKVDRNTDIVYHFKKCMFNDLYTFYEVGFSNNSDIKPNAGNRGSLTIVNSAEYSDNIGPMGIVSGGESKGFVGGNHSYQESGAVRTAKNNSFAIYSNGKELQDGDKLFTDNVEIRVENTIFNPAITPAEGASILTSPLCIESVVYKILGNSIQVILNHKFLNTEPVNIGVYYGMQSMFSFENSILTPDGQFTDWTDVNSGMEFSKSDYPDFNRFIEKSTSNGAYQSTYLLPYDLGNHELLSSACDIFIYSGGKAYHRLLNGTAYSEGMSHNWAGVYTWFKAPILDNEDFFVYEGKVDSLDLIFINLKRAVSSAKILLPEKYALRNFIVDTKDNGISIGENVNPDGLEISGANACSIILKFPTTGHYDKETYKKVDNLTKQVETLQGRLQALEGRFAGGVLLL